MLRSTTSFLLLVVSITAFASASASESSAPAAASASDDLTERPARQSSRDVKVPRGLVARIEKEYREFLEKQDVPAKEGLRRRLMHVNVEMTQKKKAALHENVRVLTPLGGGIIDMAEFVTPLRGAFHLRILAQNDQGHEIPDVRLYYVSHAVSRDVDGDSFGAGCDKYMELSHYYNQEMLKKGVELFTADQRYLSVLGGTFVLVSFSKEELHVGSVTFGDSRYPERLCE